MDFPISNRYFKESASTPEEARRMLVLANRILANEGVFDAFGHISIRNPENPKTFFISRAISPELVTMDDIILLNLRGELAEGSPEFQTFGERAIHCAVYEARPEVMCVCHPHPLELIPFASTDVPLRSIYHQDVTFYDGIPVFKDLTPECGMLINTLELGRDNAKVLLQALAMGSEIHYISREEAEAGTYQQFCKLGLARSWNYWCVNAKKAYPDIANLEH